MEITVVFPNLLFSYRYLIPVAEKPPEKKVNPIFE
jgi:hypothetical protein|tara:strand:- start:146 stop:250 length:105 start_codon:yes stop_codon:yes gene_type:complete